MKNIYYLAKKDFFQYFIKPATTSWGIIFPIVFAMAFIVRGRDINFLAPGLIAIASFFGATSMASTSITFERRFKEFERLILAPLSYWEIVLGKVVGSFIFGLFVSLITTFITLPFLGIKLGNPLLLVVASVLVTVAFSSMGVFIALIIKDPRNIMIVVNSVRLPMIFVSGVFIPLSKSPVILQYISLLMPLTYTVELLRYAFTYSTFLPIEISLIATFVWFLIFLILAVYSLERKY
ncbi:MAG: ABC transporter permease [Candidatus Asgardarchaeia archaeon]